MNRPQCAALAAFAALATGVLATPLHAAQAAPAAAQQTVPAFATDTTFWIHIGSSARTKSLALAPVPATLNARVVAQYREAMAEVERGSFGDALLTFQALLARAREVPSYHGDFAYALARAGRFEDAGNLYTRAFQLQQQNAWFVVGIAAARAATRQWADAAGTIQLAAQTDSAVLSGGIPSAAAGWFEQAGDRNGALTWSRLAVRHDSGDALSWRRIAFFLSPEADSSAEGYAAIQRFRRLNPTDQLGVALHATYLYPRGQTDSALALIASAATADSAYREYAAQLHLQVGREMVQRRNPDRALAVLTVGKQWATATQSPAYSNIIGRAQLLQLNAALTALQENRACAAARAADSLATLTEANLRAGISFDSVRTQTMLDNILPGYRQNAATAVQSCSDTPRPAPRPAARPRPARP